VFRQGAYQPETDSGRRLMAHELAHVVQQGGRADRLFRSMGGPGPCASNTTCAPKDQCEVPDKPGSASPSTSFTLTVNIDIEQADWESAVRNTAFGHTYVRFQEGNGREYTYGFYPAKDLPNESRRTVPGCVRHPDTTHDTCIEDRLVYRLSEARYKAALAKAQSICKTGGSYGQSYTCTTYADDVVRAAGEAMPSSASKPFVAFMMVGVPAIHNPNTLLENVAAERKRDPTKAGAFWNDPCLNRCAQNFDACLAAPRRPGQSGALDPSRGYHCISLEQTCKQQCPAPK
jgi:hypothetical protein